MDDSFLESMPSYFRLARNILYLSNCNTKVSAVIAKKRPLIVATNKRITHPKYVDGSSYVNSIHAEINCCLHISDEQCEGSTIFVYREAKHHPQGEYYPALAKPCILCEEILRQKRVKRVVYTIPIYPYYIMERLYEEKF